MTMPIPRTNFQRDALSQAMALEDVNAKNPWLLPRILSFLNERNIKYRVCQFSPSCTEQEIDREVSRLGMGLLEGHPVELSGQGSILAIIPSSVALHLNELSNLLAPDEARLWSPDEACERLSLVHPTNIIPPLGDLFGLQSFLSPLIEQHHAVGFFVDAAKTLITLEASEFRRSVTSASAIPVPTRSRYRAYASPGRKATTHCILGVSLESAEFHATKLITITDWIRRHYPNCAVMLGDGLHRITLQLDSAVGENEALERSKWLARDFVYSNLSVFNLRESDCRFDFVFCSEIQKTIEYSNYYSQLLALFCADKEFKNSVEAFSSEFLSRKPHRLEHSQKHVELSCRYLLEELAVICCLAQDSPCTFVYPGSLTILEEIAGGKHPFVPAPLLDIDYVELKLKSR